MVLVDIFSYSAEMVLGGCVLFSLTSLLLDVTNSILQVPILSILSFEFTMCVELIVTWLI